MAGQPVEDFELVTAIDSALAAGRPDEAAELISGAAARFVAGRSLRDLPVARLRNWLAAVGTGSADQPWLLYYQAWVAAALREHGLALVTLERASTAFSRRPPGPDRDQARRLIALSRATIAQREGRLADARARFADAARLLRPVRDLPEWIGPAQAQRWEQADPSGATAFWLTTIRSTASADDPLAQARALHNLAFYALEGGEPLPARRLAAESVRLKRGLAPLSSYAVTLNTLGMAERTLGATTAAVDDLEEARALGLRVGNSMIAAYALCNLAEVHADTGRVELAERAFAQQAQEKEAAADDFAIAYGWRAWARGRRLAGDPDSALRLVQRAQALRGSSQNRRERAALQTELGACLAAAGHTAQGLAVLDVAVELARVAGARDTLTAALLHRAVVHTDDAAMEEAAAMIEAGPFAHLSPELDQARSVVRRPSRSASARPASARPASARPGARLGARLIGPFVVETAAGPLRSESWRNRRAATLLQCLVLHRGESVHVDQLYEWIWPETGPAARASLNTAVSLIRTGLAEIGAPRELLARHDDRLGLDGIAYLDLDHFRELLEAAQRARAADRQDLAALRLHAALDLWRGNELLPSARYAAWAVPAREQAERAVQQARHDLVEVLLRLGLPERALGPALDAVASEPLSEDRHRQLIRVHLANHDAAAARACFNRLRATLLYELGQEPAAETTALLPTSAHTA